MTILFLAFLGLLLAGVPVFAATALSAILYIWINGLPPLIVVQQLFDSLDKFPLLAVPFFVLAGNLMNSSGITDRLYAFAHSLCGHVTGGLGHVNIVGSFIFSGMSGTAMADAAGVGTIELKAMRDQGYDDDFAVAITAASSTMGPIIPPSLPMILYAITANASVGALFIAGIVPGILMAIALHAHVYVVARRKGYPRAARATLRQVAVAFLRAIPVLAAPGIILGGILLGVFTPTEAGGVGAFGALLIAVVRRRLDLPKLWRILTETGHVSVSILFLLIAAGLYSRMLSLAGVPNAIGDLVEHLGFGPYGFLLVYVVIILLLGMILDSSSILLIMVPIAAPIAQEFGFDLIHFGIVTIIAVEAGLLTPPFGISVFTVKATLADRSAPIEEIFAGALPFVFVMLSALLLIAVFPPLATALVK